MAKKKKILEQQIQQARDQGLTDEQIFSKLNTPEVAKSVGANYTGDTRTFTQPAQDRKPFQQQETTTKTPEKAVSTTPESTQRLADGRSQDKQPFLFGEDAIRANEQDPNYIENRNQQLADQIAQEYDPSDSDTFRRSVEQAVFRSGLQNAVGVDAKDVQNTITDITDRVIRQKYGDDIVNTIANTPTNVLAERLLGGGLGENSPGMKALKVVDPNKYSQVIQTRNEKVKYDAYNGEVVGKMKIEEPTEMTPQQVVNDLMTKVYKNMQPSYNLKELYDQYVNNDEVKKLRKDVSQDYENIQKKQELISDIQRQVEEEYKGKNITESMIAKIVADRQESIDRSLRTDLIEYNTKVAKLQAMEQTGVEQLNMYTKQLEMDRQIFQQGLQNITGLIGLQQSLQPQQPEGFTLSEGQVRFDAQGNVIAGIPKSQGLEAPKTVTDPVTGKIYQYNTQTGGRDQINTGTQTQQGQQFYTGSGDLSGIGSGSVTAYGTEGNPYGLDIDGKIGDPITNRVQGTSTVVEVGNDPDGSGNYVILQDANGYRTRYAHLDQVNVSEGDEVTAGQQFATIGNTGNVIPFPGGDGSHVDITLRDQNGKKMSAKDVEGYLSGGGFRLYDTSLKSLYQSYLKGEVKALDPKLLGSLGKTTEQFVKEAKAFEVSMENPAMQQLKDIKTMASELLSMKGKGKALFRLPGAGLDFRKKLKQLKSVLGLQYLVDLKNSGATFGQLSNQELNFITDASNTLSLFNSKDFFEETLTELVNKANKNLRLPAGLGLQEPMSGPQGVGVGNTFNHRENMSNIVGGQWDLDFSNVAQYGN